MAQVLLQYMNYEWANPDHAKEDYPFWLRYVPSLINVFLIVLFGQIYTRLSYRLVEKENH